MQDDVNPIKIFNEFINEINKQKKYLPPFNISWTHNIHSIFAKMGRIFNFIPWYEDPVHPIDIDMNDQSRKSQIGRTDCSWFVNDETWEEKLVMEYENDPSCDIERIKHDINKLINVSTNRFLKVIVYFTNANWSM